MSDTFPGGDVAPDPGELRIAVDRKPYAEALAHGMRDPEVEVCGVLVGQALRDKHGEFVHVTHTIEGARAAERGAHVTFTHDTWNHIHAEMDRLHEGRRIVGWYHTHPDFGIFLSEMDLFIQQNFFAEPWQLAYVYDPLSGGEGFFHLGAGGLKTSKRYWLGGRQRRIAVKESAPTSNAGPADSPELARALTKLAASIAVQREAPTPVWTWVALALAGFLVVQQLLGIGPIGGSSEPGPLAIVDQDPVTGVRYGIRLYPVVGSDSSLVPVFQDAAGGTHYAAKLEPIESRRPTLDRLLGRASAPPPKAEAQASVTPQATGRRERPSLWVVLAVVGGVLLSMISVLGVVGWRARRRQGSTFRG